MKTKLFAITAIISMFGNAQAQVPTPDHVVVLMMENYGYADIVGNANAPHINALLNDSHTALFTQSFAVSHPSQPNYIMLYSGNNQGVATDNISNNTPFSTCNLGASLIGNGYSFSGYSEDLSTTGDLTATAGNYVRRHCPWTNWVASSGTNTVPPSAHQPYTSFPSNTNYASLPTVSFVIPNLANDMHNPTFPTPNYKATAISNGDNWVYNNLSDYINWAKNNNSLLIITFDEDDGLSFGGVSTSTNQIATLFIGEMVQGGSYSSQINHYNVLRTIEDMYNLPYCGNSANVLPITSCWFPLPAGIKENNDKEAVTIYPNPATENVTINFNLLTQQNVKIVVTNLLSQIVATTTKDGQTGNNQIQLSLENYKKGNYFIKIISEEKTVVKKLVIE